MLGWSVSCLRAGAERRLGKWVGSDRFEGVEKGFTRMRVVKNGMWG